VTADRLPLPPYSSWELTRDGYTLVLDAPVNGVRRVRVYNPGGDAVDEGTFAGSMNIHREARWMLASAIESGE
jgi:hypothetical protein